MGIGTHLAEFFVSKIVGPHYFGLPFDLVLPFAIGERTD
jgi:hypothetical protein